MYDSIAFHLEEGRFKIEKEGLFDGKKTNQISWRFDTGSSFVNGVREQMKNNKRYYPSIGLAERTIGSYKTEKKKVRRLEIQISLPKTRYETNRYEIDQNDFGFILKRTLEYLKMAGISTDIESLKNGVVDKLAIPKSIILPAYYGTDERAIRKLAPFNYKPKCKFRYRDYNDGWEGISINFHNDTRGFCVYCKYSEIINNGYTLAEEEIKRQVLSGMQPRNILRFELTLQTKQTLEAVLRRLIPTKKKDFTLNDLFIHKEIAPKLLLEEFDKIYNPINTALITLPEIKENKLDCLLRGKITSFRSRILMSYLANMTTKIGLSQTLKQIKQEISSSGYDRIKRELSKIIEELGEIDETTPNLIEFLRGELVKFEPIKPVVDKRHCQLLLSEL